MQAPEDIILELENIGAGYGARRDTVRWVLPGRECIDTLDAVPGSDRLAHAVGHLRSAGLRQRDAREWRHTSSTKLDVDFRSSQSGEEHP